MHRRSLVWFQFPLAILLSAAVLFFALTGFYRAAYPIRYSEAVLEESGNARLPPSLVFAVIWTESGFNPDAQSSIPARGLMQITQDTFEWAHYRMGEEQPLNYDHLFDSSLNIRYGSAILRLLLDEFGSVENALCAYHAGWGATTSWLNNPQYSTDGKTLEVIPYDDTRKYVKKVLETMQTYEALYHLSDTERK